MAFHAKRRMQHKGLRRKWGEEEKKKGRGKSNRGNEKELSIIFLIEINFKYPQIKARFMGRAFLTGRQ